MKHCFCSGEVPAAQLYQQAFGDAALAGGLAAGANRPVGAPEGRSSAAAVTAAPLGPLITDTHTRQVLLNLICKIVGNDVLVRHGNVLSLRDFAVCSVLDLMLNSSIVDNNVLGAVVD